MRHYTIPIFVPHLACPFQCVFCNQKHISGQISPIPAIEIPDIIDKHLSTMDYHNAHIEVGFFGGSFTCLPSEDQIAYLEQVQPYVVNKQMAGIRISTRPDFINDSNLSMLKQYSVTTIELGVQSLDNNVLIASGRGYKAEQVTEASNRIKNKGIQLGIQMMIGLPNDSIESSIQTAYDIAALQPDCIRIYPTLVIEGTDLAISYVAGKYKPLSLDEAIRWTAPVLKHFLDTGLHVIKVGLHPSESYGDNKILLAGPFHPAFREMVMTQLWHQEFMKIEANPKQDITINVPASQYNYSIGYKSYNKQYLKNRFNRVRFQKSDELQGLSYEILYN